MVIWVLGTLAVEIILEPSRFLRGNQASQLGISSAYIIMLLVRRSGEQGRHMHFRGGIMQTTNLGTLITILILIHITDCVQLLSYRPCHRC